ncbi:MAG: hypothetical protein IMZ61_13900 [Planctomycetes bacterium]|nr:hypothetical protein [Chloroflexota bacterium]MBE3144991.1 hypothetical protein [Planctomycetota bacterium]
MAKEQDQAQQTEEVKVDTTETKEDTVAVDKAIKTSKDFDKLLDAEGVEATPPEDKVESKKSKDSKTKVDTKADDKDTGEEETEDKEKDTKETGDAEETNVSEALAKKASDYGFTDAEIADFKDDAELEKFLGVMDSVMSEGKEDASAQADSKVKAKADDKKEDATGIKFANEDEIDPELLKGIRALEQSNKDLRDKLESVVGGLQQQQQTQFIKRFDGLVAGLGREFADTFGIGSFNDLGKRSQAYRNRQAVGQRMQAFGKGLIDQGLELPSEEELFDLAVNSLHKKKIETVKGLRLGVKTTARSKQRLGRSATKKTGNLTGEQKAVETSRKFDELIDTSEN